MKRAIFNALGPTTHILAGLISLVWAVSLNMATATVGLLVAVLIFSLLPDIDSTASVAGRVAGPLSAFIERRFGHRSLTHSIWFAGLVGCICWLWFPAPDWWLITAAWLSHLVIDMIVGERGVPLLWPGEWHFYIITIKPGSLGELFVAALCGLAILYPLYLPHSARQTAALAADPPTPTATPAPLVIRISHVYDPDTEILIRPGDTIERGQLIADLATHRHFHPLPAETPTLASRRPAAAPSATATAAPTATPTPTASPTWSPNPLVLADAQARLQQAQLRATLAAAPIPAATVTACRDAIETLFSRLWQTQLDRDAHEAAHDASLPGPELRERWARSEQYRIELQFLEGQIAEAQSRCDEMAARPHAAGPVELELAAAELRRAEIAYLETLATPTPRLEAAPTATASPTPTRTPTVTPTETPPVADETRVYSKLAGRVVDVRIVAIAGNEATVEIDVYPEGIGQP